MFGFKKTPGGALGGGGWGGATGGPPGGGGGGGLGPRWIVRARTCPYGPCINHWVNHGSPSDLTKSNVSGTLTLTLQECEIRN